MKKIGSVQDFYRSVTEDMMKRLKYSYHIPEMDEELIDRFYNRLNENLQNDEFLFKSSENQTIQRPNESIENKQQNKVQSSESDSDDLAEDLELFAKIDEEKIATKKQDNVSEIESENEEDSVQLRELRKLKDNLDMRIVGMNNRNKSICLKTMKMRLFMENVFVKVKGKTEIYCRQLFLSFTKF